MICEKMTMLDKPILSAGVFKAVLKHFFVIRMDLNKIAVDFHNLNGQHWGSAVFISIGCEKEMEKWPPRQNTHP